MITPDSMKHTADGLSIGTMIATVAGYLPEVAAVLSIVWTGIRIYETKTIQSILGKEDHA